MLVYKICFFTSRRSSTFEGWLPWPIDAVIEELKRVATPSSSNNLTKVTQNYWKAILFGCWSSVKYFQSQAASCYMCRIIPAVLYFYKIISFFDIISCGMLNGKILPLPMDACNTRRSGSNRMEEPITEVRRRTQHKH